MRFSNVYLEQSKRKKTPLSVLMIDIDKFKLINDNYGHVFGDHVIKELANILVKSTRKSDINVRFGGEEFIILLPDCDLEGAMSLGKKNTKEYFTNKYYTGG